MFPTVKPIFGQNIQNYIDAYVKAPFPKAKFKEFLILTRCNVIRQSGNNDVLLELGVSPHNVNRQGVHQRIQDEDTINAKKFRMRENAIVWIKKGRR